MLRFLRRQREEKPPKKMKVVLAAVPLINTRVPPLSIALLSAQLKKDGHEVKSFDFNIETYHAVSQELKEYWTYYKGFQWMDNSYFETFIYPNIIGAHLDSWVEKILAEKPDVVGISVTVSPSGKVLAQKLKAIDPRIKIVIGGPSCTKIYNDSEKRPCEYYDAVVHNEGELTLSELISTLKTCGEFQPVLGASILDKEGNIVFPGLRPPLMDIDTLPPPDFDDFDFPGYIDADYPTSVLREIPYYTSRGCPARCNFCMDYKMWDVQYRQKTPARIISEMEYLSERYKIKDFMLIELIFNGHNVKMRELAEELVKRNHDFRFWGHGRIDPRMDVETLKLLKRAGFRHFILGLESGSTKVLKLMRKGYTAETASRILKNFREAGMGCSVNIVTGFPGETWEDFMETIRFLYEHRDCISGMPGICACNATPGTDIYLYPEKFGIHVKDTNEKPNCTLWRTVDGENTPEEREFRKEYLVSILKKFKFGPGARMHKPPPQSLPKPISMMMPENQAEQIVC